jgi:hypothetical protein
VDQMRVNNVQHCGWCLFYLFVGTSLAVGSPISPVSVLSPISGKNGELQVYESVCT